MPSVHMAVGPGVLLSQANTWVGVQTFASPALSGTVTGTYTLGGTPTIGAATLGGTLTGTGQGIANITYISFGGTPPASGAIRFSHGEAIRGRNSANNADRRLFEWGVTAINTIAICGEGDPIQLWGNTSLQAGITLSFAGVTSGVVTMAVAAAAGTWTITLPTAVGTAGFQLTDAAGNGVTSWAAAASLREYKDILGLWDKPQDALDKILGTQVYRFHYKPGMGTGDKETEYVGIMGDEAPWAMHFNGGIVNPVNALGYMCLGFQAVDARIAVLEGELAELKAGRS